jgi:hypothetical protein
VPPPLVPKCYSCARCTGAPARSPRGVHRLVAPRSSCLYSGKLVLAATYLRRVLVDGRSIEAGAPALAHVNAVGACGTKPRRGPPAALPGAGARRPCCPWYALGTLFLVAWKVHCVQDSVSRLLGRLSRLVGDPSYIYKNMAAV